MLDFDLILPLLVFGWFGKFSCGFGVDGSDIFHSVRDEAAAGSADDEAIAEVLPAKSPFWAPYVLQIPRDCGCLIEMNCRFRPCIDLHEGKVKQIVGGSLRDAGAGPEENFVSEESPEYFAKKFREDNLTGGHVIMLGGGNEVAGREALEAWPGGMQIGGGIKAGNAAWWLDAGASHVIVTSALFDSDGKFLQGALDEIVSEIGKENLVIDLSCRRVGDGWKVTMNRWQTMTDLAVTPETLDGLLPYCDEFLIHAADVEGLCGGVDEELVALLGKWGKCPVTYAGGAASLADVELVDKMGHGLVDVTVGSALDLFGGTGVCYAELASMSGT